MKPRSKVVWKLSAVVAAVLAVAIALAAYAQHLIYSHYWMSSTRSHLRSNTQAIADRLGEVLSKRSCQADRELLDSIPLDDSITGDVRLVSHHSGEDIIDPEGSDPSPLKIEDRACAVCHPSKDIVVEGTRVVDLLLDSPDRGQILSVMAPIINRSSCGTASCHSHDEDPAMLAFVKADYSMASMDSLADRRAMLILLVVVISLLSAMVVLWFVFGSLVERPIRELIAGTREIAAHRLDFRFDGGRNDEIGELQDSFNAMTATIQDSRDELRDAKEYLEGMVEHTADIIITVNSEGLIETFNRGAELSLGYSREEVIGEPIVSLFVDPRERHAAAAYLETTADVKNYETRLRAKDGQIKTILLTLSRLHDAAGKPIGTIGISKDITQEKRLQSELVQSQKFAAIGQAVTGIQHAIKNMLNALKGGSYLIRVGMGKDDQTMVQEGRSMVEEGIERISSLSHNMLNFARDWKPDLQEVDIADLVQSVCELNRHTAADGGVELRHQRSDDLVPVRCDPKLIHMATTDILVNAVDACSWKNYEEGEQPGVVLTESSTADGLEQVIEVRDNGCGMSETVRESIFTPFFSTKKTLGTGLGLALTAKIIRMHGGEIFVESEPDKGTTFRIRIPTLGPPENQGGQP